LVGGHWLFGDDVAAVLHGRHDVAVVVGVHGGDDNHVRTLPADEVGEVAGRVGRHRGPVVPADQATVVIGHPHRAGVAQGDEIAVPGVRPAQGVEVHGGPAAGADDGVARLGHGSCGVSVCAWLLNFATHCQ